MNVNGKWFTETEAQAYIITLEHKNAALEEKHLSECRQISEYERELREAKRLLKEAVEDVERISKGCIGIQCDSCPHTGTSNGCIWRYAGEALKLIGG